MSDYDADCKQVGKSTFYLRDGFYFSRGDDGAVTISIADGNPGQVIRELTVPENEWASVVVHVSAAAPAQQSEAYEVARDLHAGRVLAP